MSYNNLYNYSSNNKPTIINNNKVLIKVDTSSNYYINITLNDFNKIYDFLVVNSKDIYLPIINNNLFIGFTMKILNVSGHTINIYSQDNQLIYSMLYLPKQGSITIVQNSNSLFMFCVIKKSNLFSWIMV